MKLKNFILRGKNGWCPRDTWNLDWYLARVISESIKYLEKHTISYPDGMTFSAWKKILNQISKDIMAPSKLDESISFAGYYSEASKVAFKKQKEALKLFVTYFNNLWD